MFVPPLGSNQPLKYWQREAEYRSNALRNGGIAGELLTLLWYLLKWTIKLATWPIRLGLSWWIKRLRERRAVSKPPYEI